MEVVIYGNTSNNYEGTVTVELPSYMVLLSDEELLSVKNSENRNELTVAAGYHAETNCVIFLTGVGELFQVELTQFEFPKVSAISLAENGNIIRIELQDFDCVEVEVSWAKRVGKHMFDFDSLADKRGARVTYVDE